MTKSPSYQFLNKDCIEAIDVDNFRTTKPYPWINPQGILTDIGYQTLLDSMLPVDRLVPCFDKQRTYNQASHNRYLLGYAPGMELPPAWQAFIDELCGDVYRDFVRNLLGEYDVRFQFHWYYTPNGCSISPHCDAFSKIGTHIFYLNTEQDWNHEWGGETLILDDNGKFNERSNPDFDDFESSYSAKTINNRSLIFGKSGNSWHGVKPINCPDDSLRKIFSVTYKRVKLKKRFPRRIKRLLGFKLKD
jgi:hypothetical protein